MQHDRMHAICRKHPHGTVQFRHVFLGPTCDVGDQGRSARPALLRQDWDLGQNEREPAQTLRRAAKRLRELDWSSVLTLAEDFAVFVVSDGPAEDLRKTVPGALRRRIERG